MTRTRLSKRDFPFLFPSGFKSKILSTTLEQLIKIRLGLKTHGLKLNKAVKSKKKRNLRVRCKESGKICGRVAHTQTTTRTS